MKVVGVLYHFLRESEAVALPVAPSHHHFFNLNNAFYRESKREGRVPPSGVGETPACNNKRNRSHDTELVTRENGVWVYE